MSLSTEAETLKNSNNQLVGYACKQLVQRNQLADVDITFYFDLLWPKATNETAAEENAIDHVRIGLIDAIANKYGIYSGVRCFEPPLDGTSWLVSVTSNSSQYSQVDIFGKDQTSVRMLHRGSYLPVSDQ